MGCVINVELIFVCSSYFYDFGLTIIYFVFIVTFVVDCW